MADGVDSLSFHGRRRSGSTRLDRLVPTRDRDVLGPADRAGLRIRPGAGEDVARHRPVDGQLAARGDEVFADRPGRRDRELPAGREDILLHGAADRQRSPGDPCVTADRSGDGDAAAGGEDVTRDGSRHVDQATARDQVTVDRAVDADGPGEGVKVVRYGLAGRDGHRVACPQLVAHRALGDGNPGQDREQGDARGNRLEQAIPTPHRSTLPSQPLWKAYSPGPARPTDGLRPWCKPCWRWRATGWGQTAPNRMPFSPRCGVAGGQHSVRLPVHLDRTSRILGGVT